MPSTSQIPVIQACRWVVLPWPTPSGTNPPPQPEESPLVQPGSLRVVGGTRMHAALRPAPPQRLRQRERWMTSSNSASGAHAPLDTRKHSKPLAWKSPPGRWARVFQTLLAWRSPSSPGCQIQQGSSQLLDHYTYALWVTAESGGCFFRAASLAGHLGLGKLIALYDDNDITIDGNTAVSFTEDGPKRYEAYGWHVQHVPDGNTEAGATSVPSKRPRPSPTGPALSR